jgi:probable rRNA maturation factor
LRQTRKVAERVLSALGAAGSELSVSIVGDRTMRSINRQYLGKDKPTNVISFSLREGEFGDLNPEALGDVLISADTAAREAEEGGITFDERFYFLLLHGILHLSGYDHERSGEAETARMESREQEIFGLLIKEGFV